MIFARLTCILNGVTTFLLIRHASTAVAGKVLTGRSPGIGLDPEGIGQAEALVSRLAGCRIDAIYSSPLERTRETCAPLAAARNLPVQIDGALIEIGFGDWTGKAVTDLEPCQPWRHFNTFRSSTPIPGGELMLEVQVRTIRQMNLLQKRHPEGVVALFSHADVIKAALTHYAGIPLDLFHRLEISPASVSIVELNDWGPRILKVNDTGTLQLS